MLMINDFDKAFTPVIEIEVLDVTFATASDQAFKSSQQEI